MKPSECIKQGWIQGRLAIDREGFYCSPNDPRACGWCAIGAVKKCFENHGDRYTFFQLLFKKIDTKYDNTYDDIEGFNDAPSRTKEEVISILEEVETEFYETK